MRLTSTYTRVAVSSEEVHQEPEDDELDTEDLDRTSGKQRWHEGSEYAICTDALDGEQHTKKWEDCKEDVLRKHREEK